VAVCDKLPDLPVIVTVAVPTAAELLAVSVKVLVVVVLVGLNDAVTPLGRPEAAKLTLLVKPFVGFTVIVLVPLVPWARFKAAGLADSVKSGGGPTVRVTVVVCVKLPDVPVMVTVAVPTVAELLAVSVRVLVVVVGFGLNAAVTPLGKPDAARLTLPANPLRSVTVMVLVPAAPPGVIVTLVGEAASVKSGVAARLYSQMPRP